MVKKQRLMILISVVAFLAVFGALLAIATVYDLEISQILTKDALPTGAYFSTNGFGLFFEAMGSAPIYLMAAFGGVIAFWWGARKGKKALPIIATLLGAVAVFLGIFFFVKDIFSYVGEHMLNEEHMGLGYILALEILLTLIIYALFVLTWKQVKPEYNDQLIKIIFVILITMAGYLIVHFVKGPVGRMRYRAMNYSGDTEFSNFTQWFVTNGKRNLVPEVNGVEISDSCKSFPSGHTYSAAVIYGLICLPDLLKKWNKPWIKAICYGGTVLYVGLVAISRIVVGAHFMSDVLFGGTIGFLCMMIGREIIIFKGEHFKVLFGIKGKKTEEKVDEGEALTE